MTGVKSSDSVKDEAKPVSAVHCPRCRLSAYVDTSIRTDPRTGRLRKRCWCGACSWDFWRDEGIHLVETERVP